MPRKAARIFLRVTGVRVERLQEIDSCDAFHEGFEGFLHFDPLIGCAETVYYFMDTWDKIYAKHAGGIYSWDNDPWVWVIEFERISKEEAEREAA